MGNGTLLSGGGVMRTCFFLVLAVAVASPALATDWVFLGAHDDQSVELYYDRHSVRVSGNTVWVRVKRVFSEDEGRELAAEHGDGQPIAYSVERILLDCAGRRIKRNAAAWFGVNGKLLERTVATPGVPWRPLRSGGLGQALCQELD